ncbi:MAG: NAD-dependent epimerase/dehydratase family protein [Bacteroidota bacterium]
MKVLVTGADGLLGSNLVRELLERDYEVRGFIEVGKENGTLTGLKIEKFYGDLLNKENVNEAVKDIDVIIHAAANTSVSPARSEMVLRVNIEGTRNVVNACVGSKIRRFIFVGSANSFGYGSRENPGSENTPANSQKYKFDYMDSKREAQDLVLEAIKRQDLPGIIVNPTLMFGKYDSVPGTGKIILGVYNKIMPGYTSGGNNYIYVKDVAVGIVNAINKGQIGHCYIFGNENLTFKEFFDKIASTIGCEAPKYKVPDIIVMTIGLLNSFIGTITGKAPTLSYRIAILSCDGRYYSAEKARNELQLPDTPVEVAIQEAFQYFKDNGMVVEQ